MTPPFEERTTGQGSINSLTVTPGTYERTFGRESDEESRLVAEELPDRAV